MSSVKCEMSNAYIYPWDMMSMLKCGMCLFIFRNNVSWHPLHFCWRRPHPVRPRPAVGHQWSGLEGVGQWQDGVEQGVLQSRGQSQEEENRKLRYWPKCSYVRLLAHDVASGEPDYQLGLGTRDGG